MRKHPHLLEINAATFLHRLSQKYQQPLTLASIPYEEWQVFRKLGFDGIWLMGVWQRSEASRRAAENFLKQANVIGSPYAVYAYEIDEHFGKPGDLEKVKEDLNAHGLRLFLDFVPNHFACDHPWTISSSQRFVTSGKEHAGWFFPAPRKPGLFLAHGRDPYFPPWTDTVQVNFFSSEMRQAMIEELHKIAKVADGVRCDMAMLGLNRIFKLVWRDFIKDKEPPEEFWSVAIRSIKEKFPEFVFMAEVYWDLEWDLQQLGFDFTYDKRLYDRLKNELVSEIAAHLNADPEYQNRSVRFIENHDEPRAVTAFGKEKSLAAAAVIATLPGMRFFHDGQLQGASLQVPIQLARGFEETEDADVKSFYEKLLSTANQKIFHEGNWRRIDLGGAILAWIWETKEEKRLVAVNYSDAKGKAQIEKHGEVEFKAWEARFFNL